jgi:3-hydroxyacyl-CoA dehydrogenase/enoyl-CoA hydratase/3-hydroxybutyryl-CoA epimerase
MDAAKFVALCEKLRQKYGERFAPPKIVVDMASAHESFYGRFAGRANRVA